MTYDANNIFAKILRGEIPSHKVYEDPEALVIMDAMPQSPGHTLIIPKAPSRNLLDADPEMLARLAPLVQKIMRAVKEAFAADGVTLVQFNEFVICDGPTRIQLKLTVWASGRCIQGEYGPTTGS